MYRMIYRLHQCVFVAKCPLLTRMHRRKVGGGDQDILGRLANVTEDATPSDDTDEPQTDTGYSYDLLGRKRAQLTIAPGDTVPNSVETSYLYDSLGRLDVMTDTDGYGNTLASYDYTVRADGKRTSSTEQTWFDENNDGVQDAGEVKTTTTSWTYDDAGRLTDEVLDHWDDAFDQTESFTYDLTGNRESLTRDKGNDGTTDEAITYTYDANDRLLDEVLDSIVNTDDTTTTYAYDQTQQTSKTVTRSSDQLPVSSQSFTYNLQGRMALVVNEGYDASGTLTSRDRTGYEYDSKSYRIKLTNETDAALDGNFTLDSITEFLTSHRNKTGHTQTLREVKFDADGNLTKQIDYTFGGDEIAQRTREFDATGTVTSDEMLVFGHDGHGSVRVLYNLSSTAAKIVQAFTFSAYGEMISLHNAVAQSIAISDRLSSTGYSGETFDAASQQQYLRARFYNPMNGRFNRLDDFAGNNSDPQSLHKYTYVHNDPVGGRDPTGLSAIFYLFYAANSISAGLTQFQLATNFTRIKSTRVKEASTGRTDPSRKDKLTLRWWHFFWNGTEGTMVVQDVDNVGTLDIVLRGGRRITMDYQEHYVEAWTNPGKARNSFNRITDYHQQRPTGRVLEKILGGNFFVNPATPWAPVFRNPDGTLDIIENWSWNATVTFKLAAVPSKLPFDKFFHNRITTSVGVTDTAGGNVTSTAPISALAGPGSPWLRFPQGKFTQAVDTYSSSFRYGETSVTATAIHGNYK